MVVGGKTFYEVVRTHTADLSSLLAEFMFNNVNPDLFFVVKDIGGKECSTEECSHL